MDHGLSFFEAVTGEDGSYLFELLSPGLYRIYLEPYKDIQTEPAEMTEVIDDFSAAELDPIPKKYWKLIEVEKGQETIAGILGKRPPRVRVSEGG